MSATTMPLSGHVSRGRRAKDRVFGGFMVACAILTLIPLTLIIGYVVMRGWSALTVNFFTKEPSGPLTPSAGGIVQSFIGTAMLTAMPAAISIPLGILAAIYLAEYGKGRFAASVRFVAEVLLSTPSIIAGAFIWAIVVVWLGSFSAFAGALALAFLMWPIIARASEEILRLVPDELREAGLALGLPRWKVIVKVVLPTAGAGLLTAVMLAVARGLGETAPLLLTTLGSNFINDRRRCLARPPRLFRGIDDRRRSAIYGDTRLRAEPRGDRLGHPAAVHLCADARRSAAHDRVGGRDHAPRARARPIDRGPLR